MKRHDSRKLLSPVAAALTFLGTIPDANAAGTLTNSVGIELVEVPSGTFVMGEDQDGDYDEAPAHQVKISKQFLISANEITLAQYQQFRPNHRCSLKGKATGMSWHDARAFCDWLSQREQKPYRLPTEAEWEYACRAGTRTPFWSGNTPPPDEQAPNPWRLKGVHDGIMEWCLDWHGPYQDSAATDPVGPDQGFAKIIRGDKPDSDERLKDERGRQALDYHRSANRAGMPPAFGSVPYPLFDPDTGEPLGQTGACHRVGFRIVQAPMPATQPEPAVLPFLRRGVQPAGPHLKQAPSTPYFRKRYLLPVPPDNSPVEAIRAAGFDRSFRPHNHSPAFEVCPNGDLLFILYTSYFEYEPGVSLIGCRLRFGADEWDMPEPIFDLPDVNDHGPLLWTDGNNQRIYLFWGTPKLESGSPPFLWTVSRDNGAHWAELRLPLFTNTIGPHSRQPINTAFRTSGGTLYVASDAWKSTSLLWATDDEGDHWYDTGGRTFGRHTTFCLLGDGGFLGLGGKSTDIEGFLPKSISRDRGRTWETSRTPFAAQGVNQRPCLLRLKSGTILFAGDFQRRGEIAPKEITERGCYVAVSRDEGATWRIKKLPGAQPHERFPTNSPTLGYSVLRQGPNGMIHLVTSMNQPCLHFEFNEAWLFSDAAEESSERRMRSSATRVSSVETIQHKFPNGKVWIEARGGVADDGRFLLHGPQRWYYPNGDLEYAATYDLGRKTGRESSRRPDSRPLWQWERRPDGISTWTRFWENGTKRSRSRWRGSMAEGQATTWDRSGKEQTNVHFINGHFR